MPICNTVDVVDGQRDHVRKPKNSPAPSGKGVWSKAMNWLEGKNPEGIQPQTRRPMNEPHYSGANYGASAASQSAGGPLYLPRVLRNPPASSSHAAASNHAASSSHANLNGPQKKDGYQTQAPPPGSYQDDDTGPSPKNLLMAVMGVKSAVNHFAKVLISDMNKHPVELEYLKEMIRRDVKAQVDRTNHWKFLVQAYVCTSLFKDFDTPNGFFGIVQFDRYQMTAPNSFGDFSKFKDKAATISSLMDSDAADESFLGRFCFKKFKSISGDSARNQPWPIYAEEWHTVESERHPKSAFYQSFLKVAVSVWLLHRLVHSFEQKVVMLTYATGSKFDRTNMESVVPGGYEEEDEENDVNTEVGFSVIPGFQVSRSVVKCEVYLRSKNSVSGHTDPYDNNLTIPEATGLRPSTDKSPPVKSPMGSKSPAGRPQRQSHAEMPTGSDQLSRRSMQLQAPGSFNDHSNYREEHVQSSASADRDAFRESQQRQSVRPAGNQETSHHSGRKNRISELDRRSPGGFAAADDRETVSVFKMPATQRGLHYVARDTALSEMRRLSNSRQQSLG